VLPRATELSGSGLQYQVNRDRISDIVFWRGCSA